MRLEELLSGASRFKNSPVRSSNLIADVADVGVALETDEEPEPGMRLTDSSPPSAVTLASKAFSGPDVFDFENANFDFGLDADNLDSSSRICYPQISHIVAYIGDS